MGDGCRAAMTDDAGGVNGESAAADAVWIGAAGVGVDEQRRVLLVLQGQPNETKHWAIPGGGKLPGESLEACCARELWEETGYRVGVKRELHVKTGNMAGRAFELHLFAVTVEGGQPTVHDPDGLIHQVAWWGAAEVKTLRFGFPEDKAWLLSHLADGPHRTPVGKLVRDGIPRVMAAQGQSAGFAVAEPKDMLPLLLAKVQEEAAEVVASQGSAAEIADLQEVLDGLARHRGYSAEQIREARAAKLHSRGGFERGFVLLR